MTARQDGQAPPAPSSVTPEASATPATTATTATTTRARARATAAWHTNLRWTGVLLALWFACTFGVSWFARELRFNFFGWPFSFWAGAQGLLILYVAMAALYAWRMNRAYAGTEPDADNDPADSGEGRGSSEGRESSEGSEGAAGVPPDRGHRPFARHRAAPNAAQQRHTDPTADVR